MTIRNPTPEEAANILRLHTAAPYLTNIRKALDWCVENPDLFSMTAPALDAAGHKVLPLDPAAVKFCFFGRVAVEAGIKLEWFDVTAPEKDKLVNGEPLQDYLAMVDISAMDIITCYDEDPAERALLLRMIVEAAEARYDA